MKKIIIFTDGSSRGNPGRGGWGAVAVYPDSHDVLHVDEIGGREDTTTNNRMEISAAANIIAHFDGFYENFKDILFIIYTDSSYLIKGATEWTHGWKKNNWLTTGKEDVKNRDLWEQLADVIEGKNIDWRLVPGHAGVPGNERCDVIATSMADNIDVDLYKGKLASYSHQEILDILRDGISEHVKNKKKSGSKSKQVAYSYISLVDGNIKTHATWTECETRVKGKSGARFKKSCSAADEAAIIKEFSK